MKCQSCGSEDVRPLGRVGSVLDWFECRPCRKVWAVRAPGGGPLPAPPAADPDPGAATCPKCGSGNLAVVSRTSELVYQKCAGCGLLRVRPAK